MTKSALRRNASVRSRKVAKFELAAARRLRSEVMGRRRKKKMGRLDLRMIGPMATPPVLLLRNPGRFSYFAYAAARYRCGEHPPGDFQYCSKTGDDRQEEEKEREGCASWPWLFGQRRVEREGCASQPWLFGQRRVRRDAYFAGFAASTFS
jgi:hypothetical protein